MNQNNIQLDTVRLAVEQDIECKYLCLDRNKIRLDIQFVSQEHNNQAAYRSNNLLGTHSLADQA